MHILILLSLFSSFCFAITSNPAVPTDPLGYWVTYHHGDPASVIEMKQSASGEYYGVVVAGLYHGESHPEAYCTECSNETWTGKYGIRKDEKVLGKSVLWNFTQEDNVWTNGHILRVKTGNLLDASFSLTDDNNALNMKIHAGFFKKTVTWVAISEDRLRQYCTHQEAFHENGKTMAIECIDALAQEEKPAVASELEASTSTVANESVEDENSTGVDSPANDQDNNIPQAGASGKPADTPTSPTDSSDPTSTSTTDIQASPQPQSTATKETELSAPTTQTSLAVSDQKPVRMSTVTPSNPNAPTVKTKPSSQPSNTKTASCSSHGHSASDAPPADEPEDSQDTGPDSNTADSESSNAVPVPTQPAERS